MSKRDVYSLSEIAGIPMAHMAWPVGKAPDLPWMTYFMDSQNGFMADNEVYVANPNWVVELYQVSSDEELESKVEAAIQSVFGPYTKSEHWVQEENCLQTTYYFKEMR